MEKTIKLVSHMMFAVAIGIIPVLLFGLYLSVGLSCTAKYSLSECYLAGLSYMWMPFLVYTIAPIIAGIALRKHKNWAKSLSKFVGIIFLFSFPIGTLIGYWILKDLKKISFDQRNDVSHV